MVTKTPKDLAAADLLNRANHTGTQPMNSVTGLEAALSTVLGAKGFRAHKNAVNQSIASGAGNVKVTYTTEVYDEGGVYDAPNSRMILTEPGLVHLRAAAYISSGAVGETYVLYIVKNGVTASPVAAKIHRPPGAVGVMLDMSVDDKGIAGDYYEVYVNLGAMAQARDVFGPIGHSFFMGHMIH